MSAVVVYFRTPRAFERLVQSLQKQTIPLREIVVVDNSSAVDGADGPPVSGADWRWIRASMNLGFAGACNAGARETSSDYLLFLNADLRLARTACIELLAAATSGTAVVGPRIYDARGAVELSARRFPTVMTGLLGRSSLLTQVLRRLGRAPSGVSPALDDQTREVDWISGACMLVRRSAFEAVGGFDVGYWLYWEDADLCRRLADGGWTVRYAADACAYHATGSSGRSAATVQAFHESAARYFTRHVSRNRAGATIARAALQLRCRWILARGRVKA